MQLLDTGTPSGLQPFVSTDSKELFEHNLNTQLQDWIWRTDTITYTLNSQGYRCPEWELCDWNNSIVLMGGSDIFGLGVKDSQTVGHQITVLSNINTINLGVNACSPMFLWANTLRLASYKIKPKAVVYLWPEPTRMTVFTSDNGIDNIKDGSHGETRLGKQWAAHQYQSYQFLRYCMMNCDLTWDCPIVQYSPLFVDVEWLDVSKSKQLKIVDYGRDIRNKKGHYGPTTYQNWAKVFLNDLKL
jgi:hypothetical protein